MLPKSLGRVCHFRWSLENDQDGGHNSPLDLPLLVDNQSTTTGSSLSKDRTRSLGDMGSSLLKDRARRLGDISKQLTARSRHGNRICHGINDRLGGHGFDGDVMLLQQAIRCKRSNPKYKESILVTLLRVISRVLVTGVHQPVQSGESLGWLVRSHFLILLVVESMVSTIKELKVLVDVLLLRVFGVNFDSGRLLQYSTSTGLLLHTEYLLFTGFANRTNKILNESKLFSGIVKNIHSYIYREVAHFLDYYSTHEFQHTVTSYICPTQGVEV